MKAATVDQVMAWRPFEDYTRERVEKLWGGRKRLTARQIAALDIEPGDRLWALLNMLSERDQRLVGCDYAARVLRRVESPDARSIEAVRVSRRRAYGRATKKELIAAWSAAWDAVRRATWDAACTVAMDAAWVAAWVVAMDAAWNAAGVAVWNAAYRDAEREWQIGRALEYIYADTPPRPIPLPRLRAKTGE